MTENTQRKFYYRVNDHTPLAHCNLETWRVPDGTRIVLATELASNPGMSVTNGMQSIADSVVKSANLDPQKCLFIECYNTGSYGSKQAMETTYSKVTFDWSKKIVKDKTLYRASNPQWSHTTALAIYRETGINITKSALSHTGSESSA